VKKTAFIILMLLVLSGCTGKSPSIISPTLSPTADPCPVEQIEQFIAAADDAMYRFTQLTQSADEIPGEDLELIHHPVL
jgi:outer membrane lipoprotein-sorting protein